MLAGWIQRRQQQVISYLIEENRILKAQLGNRRLRLTDTDRRRLAALAHPLSRERLKEMATIATPATLMRWYKRLIAQNGAKHPWRASRAAVTPLRFAAATWNVLPMCTGSRVMLSGPAA